ncbi:hypothetical protein [Nakamurella endophytica]|uniref:SurA-like protein n=1 Tax=Nakamurella endophytica TaxID=1748367 RepID=A0A917SLX5_9ACTN|nr:hypothetical protein [Nakamurella endophytica]GGL87325.1 hypothetical protein GCM10011594_03600 [Nakamurella endophytica]
MSPTLTHDDAGPRRVRRSRWAALLAGVLLLSGCSSQPGAAVVVDGAVVSQDALEARTSEVLAASSQGDAADASTRSAVNRAQLTDVIRHRIVAAAIADGTVQVTDPQVQQVLDHNDAASLAGQLQVPRSDVRDAVRDVLAIDQLLKKLPGGGTAVQDVTVRVEGLNATDRSDATVQRNRLLGTSAQVTSALSAAGSRALAPTDVSMVGRGGNAGRPDLMPTGLFDAAVGDVVLVPQGGETQYPYVVLRILSRTVADTPLTTAQLSDQGTATVIALGTLLMGRQAAGLDVRVNPRYGVWDPVALQVVPGNGGW